MRNSGKSDDDMEKYRTVDTTRNQGLSDLSNMNIPMANSNPHANRKMTRLQDKMQIFNVLYMVMFFLLFAFKTYSVLKINISELSTLDKALEVVDVLLMLGTVGIYCILTSETCLTKCFLIFGIAFNLVSLAISMDIYYAIEPTAEYPEDHYTKLSLISVIVQIIATALSEIFLIYVLCQVILINREVKRIEHVDKKLVADNQVDSSITDEGSVVYDMRVNA